MRPGSYCAGGMGAASTRLPSSTGWPSRRRAGVKGGVHEETRVRSAKSSGVAHCLTLAWWAENPSRPLSEESTVSEIPFSTR